MIDLSTLTDPIRQTIHDVADQACDEIRTTGRNAIVAGAALGTALAVTLGLVLIGIGYLIGQAA